MPHAIDYSYEPLLDLKRAGYTTVTWVSSPYSCYDCQKLNGISWPINKFLEDASIDYTTFGVRPELPLAPIYLHSHPEDNGCKLMVTAPDRPAAYVYPSGRIIMSTEEIKEVKPEEVSKPVITSPITSADAGIEKVAKPKKGEWLLRTAEVEVPEKEEEILPEEQIPFGVKEQDSASLLQEQKAQYEEKLHGLDEELEDISQVGEGQKSKIKTLNALKSKVVKHTESEQESKILAQLAADYDKRLADATATFEKTQERLNAVKQEVRKLQNLSKEVDDMLSLDQSLSESLPPKENAEEKVEAPKLITPAEVQTKVASIDDIIKKLTAIESFLSK